MKRFTLNAMPEWDREIAVASWMAIA